MTTPHDSPPGDTTAAKGTPTDIAPGTGGAGLASDCASASLASNAPPASDASAPAPPVAAGQRPDQRPDQRKAYLYGIATVAIWSTVATAFKLALRQLDPLQLLLVSTAVSLLVLAAILLVRHGFGGVVRELAAAPRRELLRAALLGVLNPFAYYIVLFKAYALLPAQVAQPVNYTWAITLTLLSVPLLGHRVTRRELLAVAVSYAGVVVIATRGDVAALAGGNVTGVALALVSTVIWALYWIGNARSPLEPVLGLFCNFAAGLPLVLAATVLFSSLPLRAELWPGLAAAAYVGAFEMGIAFVFWLKAMRLTESAARIGNLIFFSPFLSLVFIALLLGERILPTTLAGLVLIVAGNLLQRRG
ncbi:EamA-like transporter family protein [anaerobic digester metagenome]